jgi:phosphatidyl-myo-inositol dimannoside synthase
MPEGINKMDIDVIPEHSASRPSPLYFAVQTRFHRDFAGHIRTDHGYARYASWEGYLAAFSEMVLIARVSPIRSDSGELVEGDRLRVVEVPYYRGLRAFFWRYRHIVSCIEEVADDPLAVYGARVPDALGMILQRRARQLDARFIAQIVGDPEDVLLGGVLGKVGRILAPLARRLVARSIKRAAGVIYVTRRTLQRKYPASPGTPTLSRSNVELDQRSFADCPRDYGKKPARRPVRLITAGSQEQTYKGHDILIDAMNLLKSRGVEAEACIIGGGRYHQSLRDRAVKAGVDGQIEFVGQLSNAVQVRERVALADIFVLPSRTEGLSRALIEAMATGIACIGSSVGGTPELLPGICLFPPESADALASAVTRLVGSPASLTDAAAQTWLTASDIAESYAGPSLLSRFLAQFQPGDNW